jgi:hypothetical protein
LNARGLMSLDKVTLKNQVNTVLECLNKHSNIDQYQVLSSHNMFGLHTMLLAKKSIHTRI